MRRSTFFSPMRETARAVCAALLACGAAQPALAQRDAGCALPDPAYLDGGPSARYAANHCIRDVAEGLAAVLLPAAQVPIDDVARMDDGHRWGFLDEEGALRIAPRFHEVGSFSHGLAAAREGHAWGYIDPQGEWAIAPAFEQAEPFSEAGLAAVRRDGRWVLIDRTGETLRELDPGVVAAELAGAAPARLTLRHATRYMTPQGDEIPMPPDTRLIEPFGAHGLYIAQHNEDYGILDSAGQWRVEPRFAAIEPWQSGEQARIAAAYEGRRAVRLIRAEDGSVLEPLFEEAGAVTSRFGMALDEDGLLRLFTLAGEQVLELPVDEAVERLREEGEFLVWTPERGAMRVIAPEGGEVVEVPAGLQPIGARGPVLLFGKSVDGPVQALVTPAGQWVRAPAADAWLAAVVHAQARGERIWLRDEAGRWVNVIDAQGKPLLDAQVRRALAQGRWQRLDGPPGAPLALSRTPDCGCAEGGAGLIDAAGRLIADAAWLGIEPADSEAGAARPDPVFTVRTAAGVGLIDARGEILAEPGLSNIGTFQGEYAVAYGDAGLVALERSGVVHALPDVFLAEPVGGSWFRFLETALVDAQWGIYDVAAQQVVREPAFAQVGPRHGERTLAAVHAEGGARWGMLDAQGEWVLHPEFAAFEALPDGEWKISSPGAQGKVRVGVARADGSWLVEPVEGLELDVGRRGGWAAHAGSRSWVHGIDGGVLASGEGERFSNRGGWFAIERRAQSGYLNAQAEWALGPFDVDSATAFAGADRVAMLVRGDAAWLIDEQGGRVADLPRGQGWRWPVGSDGPYRVGAGEAERRITQYADARGGIVRTVEGEGGPAVGGRIAVLTSQRRVKRVDGDGKESATWLFDTLIPAGTEAPSVAGADARYGYVDEEGRYAVPPLYAAVQSFRNGRAVASTWDTSLLIDTAGRPLARVEYECGVHVLYGAGGTRLWPEQLPVRCDR